MTGKQHLKKNKESGFSLAEVVVAMVILLIAIMGVFATFAYAINYNAGNNSRSEALAILQQEAEKIRSAKFTPAIMDTEVTGGVKLPKTVFGSSQNSFRVDVTVDDDPNTAGVQIDATTTIKEVTIIVALTRPTPGWQTAVPATVVVQRVRSN